MRFQSTSLLLLSSLFAGSSAFSLPPNAPVVQVQTTQTYSCDVSSFSSVSNFNSPLMNGIRDFLIPPAYAADGKPKPPTNDEIKLLREALGALYGERNPEKAVELITKAISAWERQAPDERAALYRVRGDCYMGLVNAEAAIEDFTTTITLLTGPGGELADPDELPAAYLGRGRSLLSLGVLTDEQYQLANKDYQLAMRLTSREEWDTNEELEADGAQRNPYAAWEWGMAQRGNKMYNKAAETHIAASSAFKEIGDRARSVIAKLDAGIDLASAYAATSDKSVLEEAKKVLTEAIQSTTSVEGRDIELLQRVIAKEGEARIALASILWSNGEKSAAEAQLGEACGRLDELQRDADAREKARIKSGAMPPVKVNKLKFTIDDTVGTECSCSRFKNEKFLDATLHWPKPLQEKVTNLNKLA